MFTPPYGSNNNFEGERNQFTYLSKGYLNVLECMVHKMVKTKEMTCCKMTCHSYKLVTPFHIDYKAFLSLSSKQQFFITNNSQWRNSTISWNDCTLKVSSHTIRCLMLLIVFLYKNHATYYVYHAWILC